MSRRTVRPGLVWSGGLCPFAHPRHKQTNKAWLLTHIISLPSSLTFALARHWTPCRAVRQSRARSALWQAGLYSLATFLRLCAPGLSRLTLPSPLSHSPQTLHATLNDVPPLVSVFPPYPITAQLLWCRPPPITSRRLILVIVRGIDVPIPTAVQSYADSHPADLKTTSQVLSLSAGQFLIEYYEYPHNNHSPTHRKYAPSPLPLSVQRSRTPRGAQRI